MPNDPIKLARDGIRALQSLAEHSKASSQSVISAHVLFDDLVKSCAQVVVCAAGLRQAGDGAEAAARAAARTRAGRGPVALGKACEASAFGLCQRLLADAAAFIEQVIPLPGKNMPWRGRTFEYGDACGLLRANLPAYDDLDPLRAELEWEAANSQPAATEERNTRTSAAPGGQEPASKPKEKRTRCPRGKGEEWLHLALLAVHQWDSDASAADGGVRGLVGSWTPATLAELAKESGTSEGTASTYMDKLFGSGGGKADGMERYRALCNRKSRDLAAVLRKIDGGGPDRFSGGQDALDHVGEEGMAGARRGRTGERIAARFDDPHGYADPD